MTDNYLKENASVLEYIQSLTVLIVEDSRSTQMIYDMIFEDVVGKLIFANDGEEGYTKFIDTDIDIVISDYNMPILNGLDMIEKIRDQDQDIPIILVSAIEEVSVIIDALHLNVNNFIKKPINNNEVLETVIKASKLLIANNFLEEQRDKKLKELQKKDEYSSYQEDLSFAKEVNIIRNDFYHQMIGSEEISLVDFLYKPLDVMSGDAYSARIIDENITFYLMVDGMGKGLSASLSAMLMTSFTNHIIDKMIFLDAFDFSILIHETMEYIKPILLEEEALAIDYVLIDKDEEMIYYSKFAMPVLLMENKDGEIVKIRSNNPPLCKWQPTFNVGSHDIRDIRKFLIYSDGIPENDTIYKDRAYADFIENDFKNSFTKEDFKAHFFSKVNSQEDDLTMIFIHTPNYKNTKSISKTFASTLDDVDRANEWYSEIWQGFTKDEDPINSSAVVFTELFMNAYEHGNLGINTVTKHRLLDEDNYFETLIEKEAECNKQIVVKIDRIMHSSGCYVTTQISDEGDGFDTTILNETFKNLQTFNGRGVFVSRQNSLGIYYNTKGNVVLYLHKISKD
ncbi:MAG: response regulator [Campylobacterota bacterium]|nr:response regulator [Campylobacterota bacterium]